MATVKKPSVAPFYAVAAVWLGWSIFLPLYRLSDYMLCAGLSLAAALAANAIWPSKTWTVPDTQAAPAAGEPKDEAKPQSANSPEIDALIAERDKAVSEMDRLNASIQDPTISAQIDHLKATTQKIIDVVVGKPEKLPQIRRFMNYYLPTTLKLLNSYDRMDSAGVSGTNIDGAKGKIEDMMSTICAAFDKQLDSLYGDEAMDISADITVMEQMLRQEGLSGGASGIQMEL